MFELLLYAAFTTPTCRILVVFLCYLFGSRNIPLGAVHDSLGILLPVIHTSIVEDVLESKAGNRL